MRGYGWITPLKLGRKIHYLRRMSKPNHEDGAWAHSWRMFWKVLHELKLAKKLYHSY